MTFQMHVQIGTFNTASSRIQYWAARDGQPSILIEDSIRAYPNGFTLYCSNIPGCASAGGRQYGKVWLLPYMTDKDPTEVWPTTYTWYDELIISRQKISDPR